ncbi:MAG: peptidase M75 [Prevotella sp.]|nr:peptidase M75 [Prevotella sp.]
MFKASIFAVAALATVSLTSCSDDDDDDNKGEVVDAYGDAENLEYNSENAAAWGNYAVNVAKLLNDDSQALYNEWNNSFAKDFKAHNAASGYKSAVDCVNQILEGCIDIANEVGTAKIGEPVDYWTSNKKTQALYAVESWYSWHSRDDYKNNILSIANSLLGQPITGSPAKYDYKTAMSNGSLTQNSVIVKCMSNDKLRAASIAVWQNVGKAWSAIDAIPQPFRNNIGSKEAADAMDACAELVKSLEELNGLVADNLSEKDCQAIVDQFVDKVALPTYKDLAEKNKALLEAVQALQKSPSNATFEKACEAWLASRQPWETSEAFLFGPVSELGLDPNMDSWPLDQEGIVQVMKEQKWSSFQWSGEYDEESEAIEAAQSLRGFHTLEYLLFKDGKARTVK